MNMDPIESKKYAGSCDYHTKGQEMKHFFTRSEINRNIGYRNYIQFL